jgi:hypothetical protein
MNSSWVAWPLLALALLTGGWMLFDGARALTKGDYTTASSGSYAGQLGPWANIIKAVGLDPRSMLMKLAFVLIGLLWIASALANLFELPWARTGLVASAILSLWFLPFGTVTGIITLAILFFVH